MPCHFHPVQPLEVQFELSQQESYHQAAFDERSSLKVSIMYADDVKVSPTQWEQVAAERKTYEEAVVNIEAAVSMKMPRLITALPPLTLPLPFPFPFLVLPLEPQFLCHLLPQVGQGTRANHFSLVQPRGISAT